MKTCYADHTKNQNKVCSQPDYYTPANDQTEQVKVPPQWHSVHKHPQQEVESLNVEFKHALCYSQMYV